MSEKTLLSICIPTYNRAKYLKSSLLSIYNQTDNLEDFEVIVSDNASPDNTEFVAKQFTAKSNFKFIKQAKNIGFSGNVTEIVKYASGEYCWIVGDDDFILPDRIRNIINLLKSNDVDFVYAKVDEIHTDDYHKYLRPFHTGMLPVTSFEYYRVAKWEELLKPEYSIIFLGEVMASIFRRSVWLSYTPPNISSPAFSTLESTYTHSVIFANTFVGKSAIYIKSPTITALSGEREWWDKVGYIVIVHVRNLLKLYESNGVSASIMQDCWNAFIRQSIPYAVKFLFNSNIAHRDQISLKEYFKDMLSKNRSLSMKLAYREIKSNLRTASKEKIKRILKIQPKELRTDYQTNLEIFEKNRVKIENDFKIQGKVSIVNEGKMEIGLNFEANSGESNNPIGGDTILRLITQTKNAFLKIGSNVGISNSTIVCWESITIEDNVMIGGSVKIWDTNYHSLDPLIRTGSFDDNVKTKPILIKEYAFIGAGTIILKGVTIGKNSVIAAGSVVNKNIPDDVVAGGNPCQIIKKL